MLMVVNESAWYVYIENVSCFCIFKASWFHFDITVIFEINYLEASLYFSGNLI